MLDLILADLAMASMQLGYQAFHHYIHVLRRFAKTDKSTGSYKRPMKPTI